MVHQHFKGIFVSKKCCIDFVNSYQFRIGGRYFPAAPVQCSATVGGAITNGAAEAYKELQKSLNIVGDYRLSTATNATKWGLQATSAGLLQEFDYSYALGAVSSTGIPTMTAVEAKANAFCGTIASSCFGMATDLETSNGVEISGLNAEEQSDIAFIANWKSAQVTGATQTINSNSITGGVPSALEVYSYYDAMIILRENNVLELIQ